mmetsp:Transcript_15100/g.30598  ORF Transcript_15100/g.30598 Transcript_15100/m.30598 type:complete len:111 (+) Transcript_15100:2675-3007(+)
MRGDKPKEIRARQKRKGKCRNEDSKETLSCSKKGRLKWGRVRDFDRYPRAHNEKSFLVSLPFFVRGHEDGMAMEAEGKKKRKNIFSEIDPSSQMTVNRASSSSTHDSFSH